MGGASAIAITIDKNSGGCSTQDVVNTVKEQATAANDFPSPLPVIVRDLLVDEFQIALAKASGSSLCAYLFMYAFLLIMHCTSGCSL
jgi:indole-3-glycerol phosphate synthase